MSTGHGLLTEYDRECLRGEHGSEREAEARARVRERIFDLVSEDVDLLADRHPDLVMDLQDVVGGGQASLGDWGRETETADHSEVE